MGPALLVVIQGAAVDEPLPRAECGRMRRARAGRAIAFVGKNPRALPWVDDPLLPKDSSRLEVADDECDHRAGEQRDQSRDRGWDRRTLGSGRPTPVARSSSSSIFA